MPLPGTQADMQCSYIPKYYSTADLNSNPSSGTWHLNNFDRSLQNGYYYNGGLTPSSPDQHLVNKEILKQTMLRHDAIFRNQLQELHRLYSRQRELMDEMRMSELYRHHLCLKTVESNPNLDQDSLEDSRKTIRVSSLPWLNPACCQSSVPGAENGISPPCFVEQKTTQAVHNPAEREDDVKRHELLESKCKKVGKKILDLELPADEYIDSEEEESLAGKRVSHEPQVPDYSSKRVSEDVQESDEEVFGGIDLNVVFQEDNVNWDSFSRKVNGLTDLNEPIELDDEPDAESNKVMCHVLDHREIKPYPDLPGKTNSDNQVELEENLQRSEEPEACSIALHLDKNEGRQDFLSDNDATGQSSSNMNSFSEGIREETLRVLSEDTETAKAQDSSIFHELDQSSRKSRRKRKVLSLESMESNFPSCKHTSNELIPLADVMKNKSSQRRRTHELLSARMVVQALPCFGHYVQWKESSKFRGRGIVGGKSHRRKNVKFNTIFHSGSVQRNSSGNESSAYGHCGPKKSIKGSADVKSPRVVELNSVSSSCSSDVAVGSISKTDGGKKLEDSSGVGPRVSIRKSYKICRQSTQLAKSFLPKTLENLSDEVHNADIDVKDDRLVGVINLDDQSLPDELIVESIHDKKFPGLGFSIDLNSCINEGGLPQMPPSAPAEIYLEAPVSPENKESSPPRGESDENQIETPCQRSVPESENLLEEHDRTAAEAIVSISSFWVHSHIENDAFTPFEMLQVEPLDWFARIVSTVVDDPESEFGIVLSCKDTDDNDEYLSHGIDYFEAMTLKLEESKEVDYFRKTYVEGEEATLSSLPSQSMKGRARGRRQQRKDFQSEILPSLASLSRYEVTKDLQAIGGLIEAAQTRQSPGARSVGRNARPRGRRRKSSVSAVVESATCTQQSDQPSQHNELAIRVRSLVGWSTITKRRTGQRCRASNPRLILGLA